MRGIELMGNMSTLWNLDVVLRAQISCDPNFIDTTTQNAISAQSSLDVDIFPTLDIL